MKEVMIYWQCFVNTSRVLITSLILVIHGVSLAMSGLCLCDLMSDIDGLTKESWSAI